MIKERLTKTVTLELQNSEFTNKFKISYGTFNRTQPDVIFVNISCWILPKSQEAYEFNKKINNKLSYCGLQYINKNDTPFKKDVLLLTTKIPIKQLNFEKKSFLSFELFLKQKEEKIYEPKDLKEDISQLILILLNELEETSNNILTFHKNKKL